MSSNKKKLSIIILAYNSQHYIRRCLDSLTSERLLIKEVIVVDNNSSDDTIDEINKAKITTRIIKNKKNFGFSKGINIGVKSASGDEILILNPDITLIPGSLYKLLDCQKKTSAGIVGGKSKKVDNSLHNSFVKAPSLLTGIFDFTNLRKIVPSDIFHKQHYYLNEKYPTTPKDVDAVSGAFILIKKEIFDEIGLFDESFFMYLEDIDFCVRAKQEGYKIVFCPSATVIHEGGASSKNKDKINHKAWSDSRRYYFKKHFSKFSNIIAQPLFLIDDYVINIWRKLKSR